MRSEPIPEKEQPHSTAYLDGLRGVAALVVLSFHTLWAYFAFVEYGYGDGPANRHFLQLPVVRLVHAGHAMVPVFFVVGGYVMALKPLRKIRARDCKDLHLSLAGSMIRKAIRLYLPAVIVTLVAMLTLHFGLWELPRRFLTGRRFFNYPDKHPLREKTIFAEASRWARATVGLANIFSYVNHGFILPYYNPYDPHLWYLPFELRASLVTAAVLLAVSRPRRPAVRTALTLAAAILATSLDRWECTLSLAGALLADLDTHLPPSTTASLLPSLPSLAAALYLLSTPNLRIPHAPGYALLRARLVPAAISDPKRALHGAGAVLLLAALRRCPRLRRPLRSRAARAAGRRSYALYVVHGPVLHVVGYGVAAGVWGAVGCRGGGAAGEEELWRWAVGAAAGSVGAWGVAWWAAGWFERVVERWCRGVAGRVEAWCVGERRGEEEEEEGLGTLPR